MAWFCDTRAKKAFTEHNGPEKMPPEGGAQTADEPHHFG
jgi:hypothetical protein